MVKIFENKKFYIKNSVFNTEKSTKYETGRKVQKVHNRILIVIICGNLNTRFLHFVFILLTHISQSSVETIYSMCNLKK